MDLASTIRDVPDFPQKGILFKDITTLLKNPAALQEMIKRMVDYGQDKEIDLIELLEKNPGDILMKQLRNMDELPEPCSSCDQNEICFGCRSSAYYYSGDMFGCDPKCSKCNPS